MVISLDRYRRTRTVKASVEMTLGERIELTRQNRGLSQAALGRIAGYTQQAISRIESDEVSVSPTDMALLARALCDAGLLCEYCDRCPVALQFRTMDKPIKPVRA